MDELNNGEQGQYVEPGKNEKKNNTRKIVKRTLITAGLALAVYMVYSIVYLFISPDRNIQQIYLVPEDAAFIIQSSAPIEDWEKFSGSETWQCLRKAKSFEEVAKSVEKLDSVVKSNKVLLSLVGQRDLLISLHKTRATDWDFLLIVDMQKASKMDLLKDQVETVLAMSGFTVTNRMHNGINILEMRDPDTRDVFYTAFVDNHLVGSYTSGLVESAINSLISPVRIALWQTLRTSSSGSSLPEKYQTGFLSFSANSDKSHTTVYHEQTERSLVPSRKLPDYRSRYLYKEPFARTKSRELSFYAFPNSARQ